MKALFALLAFFAAGAVAAPEMKIPRVTKAPELSDFMAAFPVGARAEAFVQRVPNDGKPSKVRTVAYLSFDDRNL